MRLERAGAERRSDRNRPLSSMVRPALWRSLESDAERPVREPEPEARAASFRPGAGEGQTLSARVVASELAGRPRPVPTFRSGDQCGAAGGRRAFARRGLHRTGIASSETSSGPAGARMVLLECGSASKAGPRPSLPQVIKTKQLSQIDWGFRPTPISTTLSAF